MIREVLITGFAMFCLYGCTRSPYKMHYQATVEGLKPISKPTQYIVSKCTLDAMEQKVLDYQADGYVVIGKSEFVTNRAYHKEIGQYGRQINAEIVLYTNIMNHSYYDRRVGEFGNRTVEVQMYRHLAVYLAKPLNQVDG